MVAEEKSANIKDMNVAILNCLILWIYFYRTHSHGIFKNLVIAELSGILNTLGSSSGKGSVSMHPNQGILIHLLMLQLSAHQPEN